MKKQKLQVSPSSQYGSYPNTTRSYRCAAGFTKGLHESYHQHVEFTKEKKGIFLLIGLKPKVIFIPGWDKYLQFCFIVGTSVGLNMRKTQK